MHVQALKPWGDVSTGDVFEVDDDVAKRWANKSRVKIVEPKESPVRKPRTEPIGPSETKPVDPSEKKGSTHLIDHVGASWYRILIDGKPVLKDDGSVRKFRKASADKYIRETL